ncbi:MAG: electron transfer flavoprotein subunit alpha/FixB family protein [Saprospiraceae bacterium]|nr:electron transfer flavoprotein subunit alpha/FixB family protein [Saprospiraceae bacterium]
MILVLAETLDGKLKKSAFEAVTFGAAAAAALSTQCKALVLGTAANPSALGKAGASEVLHLADPALDQFDDQVFTSVIADVATEQNARCVVLYHSSNGKALVGRLAIRLKASSASSVQEITPADQGIRIKRPAFSGKAIAWYHLHGERHVVTLMPNAVQADLSGGEASVVPVSVAIPERQVKVLEVRRVEGTVPLPEAELVVSAGRGMKDPSNWGIIEDLAAALGASTACSRPVSDSGWRPHHEHVGQTGLAIRPNLYIAIGISGAIQHLAGVNNSKVIVVINKDPEAPFFKAADYGVQADLFDVVPRLTEAVKRFKNSQ